MSPGTDSTYRADRSSTARPFIVCAYVGSTMTAEIKVDTMADAKDAADLLWLEGPRDITIYHPSGNACRGWFRRSSCVR